jgi:hypothetical protein
MPKVSLKPVGQQIRAIQKQLRSSRKQAAAEQRTEIDTLIEKLDGLHEQATTYCPKGMDGLTLAAPRVRKKAPAKKAARGRRR